MPCRPAGKLVDSLPISPHILFGEGLQPVIAKAASSDRTYEDMADGFVQAVLVRPTPPSLTNLRTAVKGREKHCPCHFMHIVPSPPTRAGAQQVLLEKEETTARSCAEDFHQAKGFLRPEEPAQRQTQRWERQRWKGSQDDLTRCPGPELDLGGSWHVALWPECPSPYPLQDRSSLMGTFSVTGQRSQCQVS